MSTRIRSFAQLSPIESTYNQHRRQLLKQGEAKFGRSINVKHEIDENNPKIHVCMSYVRKAWYRWRESGLEHNLEGSGKAPLAATWWPNAG
jgi:hypothetical protein